LRVSQRALKSSAAVLRLRLGTAVGAAAGAGIAPGVVEEDWAKSRESGCTSSRKAR
jgi:hypothetical protein